MSEEAAYDAVAAQAAASAIAAKFAQQHAAGEGDVPADDLASGKRKYEEGASADPLGDEHVRKRSNFSGPEGAYNGVSAGHVCRPCSDLSLAMNLSADVSDIKLHEGSVRVFILISLP